MTDNEEEVKARKKSETIRRNVKHSDLFVSTSDPDTRVSRKQGKLPALNHLGITSVDTEHHVICGAMADFADTKDSDITEKKALLSLNNLL